MTRLLEAIHHAEMVALSPLRHSFCRAWSEGRLTKDALRGYAGQYYHHVLRFPTYVSALHSRCPSVAARRRLLENLTDEEGNEEHHAELWLRFCDALELDRGDVESTEPLPETARLHRTFRTLAADRPFAEGIAALHAYETHVPEVVKAKLAALRSHYGIADERGLQFFTVHQEADVWHSKATGEILEELVRTEGARGRAREGARRMMHSLWHFLDGVDRVYGRRRS